MVRAVCVVLCVLGLAGCAPSRAQVAARNAACDRAAYTWRVCARDALASCLSQYGEPEACAERALAACRGHKNEYALIVRATLRGPLTAAIAGSDADRLEDEQRRQVIAAARLKLVDLDREAANLPVPMDFP